MQYYGMYPIKKTEEALQLINNFKSSFDDDKSIRWGILLEEENKIIGTCGFHNWSTRHKRAEIGYELNLFYQGYGYMKKALIQIIHYAFDTMGFNRLEAMVYPENMDSQRSLELLGFEEEGLLKEYMIFRDKAQDVIFYSLLKENYQRQKLYKK